MSKQTKTGPEEQDKKQNEGKKREKTEKKLNKNFNSKRSGKSRPKQDDGARDPKRGTNDISWWNKYPDLLNDATRIPFNRIKGVPFTVQAGNTPTSSGTVSLNYGMRVEYYRTPGQCTSATSPFNYQMRQLWLDMHRKYRGIGTYEPQDLGMVIWAIINVFADVSRAERIYGVINKFNTRNRTYPTKLLQALGVRGSNIAGDSIANFRYQINRIIHKLKALCLPTGLAAFECFNILDGNVFVDSDSDRATWIAYDCPVVYYYDATSSSLGGCVRSMLRTGYAADNYGACQTLQQVIDDLEFQTNILLADTDVARMCSDMLAAYGSVQTLEPLSEDYMLDFVKDETRLLQFHNATINGAVSGMVSKTFVQSLHAGQSIDTRFDSIILYQEYGDCHFELASAGPTSSGLSNTTYPGYSATDKLVFGNDYNNWWLLSSDSVLLDIWKDDVSNDDVAEMTRFTTPPASRFSMKSASDITVYYAYLSSFGLTVVGNIIPFDDRTTQLAIGTSVVPGGFGGIELPVFMPTILMLLQFDWHPLVFLLDSQRFYPIYDMDNYTIISRDNLNRIHESCVMSAFKIDGVSTQDHV